MNDEDIEILEKHLRFIKPFDNNSAYIPALENLIKEYKELEKRYKIRKEIYYRDIKAVDGKWKSKVREKIEETNNEKLNYNEDDYWFEQEVKGYAIDKLQELLQEGDDK